MINRLLNRMVLCCASLLPVLSATTGHAQDTAPPTRTNAVYVELLGNGGVYSVNYERALTPAVRVRVGAASWTTDSFWSDAETRIQTFPMTLHVVSGGGAHHLETGIGVLPGHRGRDRDFGVSGGFVSLIAWPAIGMSLRRAGSSFVLDSHLSTGLVRRLSRTPRRDSCRHWGSASVRGSERLLALFNRQSGDRHWCRRR